MASSGFWFPNSSTEPYYPALWREWLALYWHTTGWVSGNSGTTLSEVNQYTIKKGDGFTRFFKIYLQHSLNEKRNSTQIVSRLFCANPESVR